MSALTLPRQLQFSCHFFACMLQFLITQSYCSFFPLKSTASFSKLVAIADFFFSSSLRAWLQALFNSNYPSLAQHTFSFLSSSVFLWCFYHIWALYPMGASGCLTPFLRRAGVSGIQTPVIGVQAAEVIRCGECKTLLNGLCKRQGAEQRDLHPTSRPPWNTSTGGPQENNSFSSTFAQSVINTILGLWPTNSQCFMQSCPKMLTNHKCFGTDFFRNKSISQSCYSKYCTSPANWVTDAQLCCKSPELPGCNSLGS